MGRPLNKKYFGNRNVGSPSTTADNGIGGEGIASINWSSLGTFRTTPSGLALPAPSIPGGVQATWSAITYRVNGVVTSAGKLNLAVGWYGTNNALFPGMIAIVTSVSGTNAVFSVLPINGGSPGSDLASVPNGGNTNTITLTKAGGSGSATSFVVDVNLQIVAMSIVEQGSGYTGSETFTVTVAGGMDPPAGTIVLTTDTLDANGNQYASQSGAQNRDAYEENAIIIRAKTTSGGTAKIGDIIKQTNSHSYQIKTADGTAVCKLVATTSLQVGQAYIVATATGGTYYVTKLTAHRALLVPITGTQFADSHVAKWNVSSPVQNVSVTLAND